MSYRVDSTHTFAYEYTGDRTYDTPVAAWSALAEDYAASDCGFDETEQAESVAFLAAQTETGTVKLVTGEAITVAEHDGAPCCIASVTSSGTDHIPGCKG